MNRRWARWLERFAWALGGAWVAAAASVAAGNTPDALFKKLEILAEVFSHVENNYVDPVGAEALIYGAAQGVMATLDEHSAFFEPEEFQNLIDATEGEYAGIGVEMAAPEGRAQIVSVLEASPAQRAGLKPGDHIVAIDGRPTREEPFDRLHHRLRGPVGSKVVLRIQRADRHRPWDFTLVRSWVRLAPTSHRALGDHIHYIQLKGFPRRAASDMAALLERVQTPRGLVLDLRDNPGGLFDEAVEVSDLFLTGGPVVTAVGRDGRVLERRQARPQAYHPRVPLAVLVNEGSASAAEVVAGALADRGRARLFGRRTYGKGSVQTMWDLSDGSGLKLTIARYLTPSGRAIDGSGLEPDVTVPEKAGDAILDRATRWLRRTASAQ